MGHAIVHSELCSEETTAPCRREFFRVDSSSHSCTDAKGTSRDTTKTTPLHWWSDRQRGFGHYLRWRFPRSVTRYLRLNLYHCKSSQPNRRKMQLHHLLLCVTGAFASRIPPNHAACTTALVARTCQQLKDDFPNATLLPDDRGYLNETKGWPPLWHS